MKKILSLALVLAMVLTMSVTAFAAEIKQDTENKTGSTDITYTANESYVVTIPDSMTVGTDATVSVSNVTLAKDYKLTVSVSSMQYNDGWKLKNGDDTIGYTLKIDDTDVANNGTVLTAKSGETPTKTLKTALTGTAKYSGTYTDTLTFSVSTALTSDVTTVSNGSELKTALTSGGKIKLSDDFTLSNSGYAIDIKNSTSVELDLNGKKLTAEDSLLIRQGSTLTLSDNAGSGQLLLDININLDMTTAQITCYGALVVDGGSYKNTFSYSSSIFIGDESADVTINGGTIDSIEVISGKLTVTGGYIGKLECSTSDTVEITGGTFGFDPTEYIDTSNYTVTNNGDSTWTVTAK